MELIVLFLGFFKDNRGMGKYCDRLMIKQFVLFLLDMDLLGINNNLK